MSVRVTLEGFSPFVNALEHLPETLQQEARGIVAAAAEQMGQEQVAAYPIRTTNLHPSLRRRTNWYPPGNLKGRVVVDVTQGAARVQGRVRSQAPHADIWEHGTKPRRTKAGANRGQMPEPPVEAQMIPRAIRIRRKMRAALADLVRSAGFEVSGD